ncbi:MAG: sigma 54-interacting transcriptional regulator [Thermoanaerobaculia bacterium]
MILSDLVSDGEDAFEETFEGSPPVRERLSQFLSLEHPILPTFLDLDGSRSEVSVRLRRREGTPVAKVRPSRETGAALFVQAASALLFLGSRGFPLELSDFEDARVEIWSGAPHLWLTRTPRTAYREPLAAEPAAALLAGLVPFFFGPRGPRSLLDSYLNRMAAPARAETWVSEIFRAFSFLDQPAFASVRKRCLGFSPAGFDDRERRHKSRALSAKLKLSGRRPRIFVPGRSTLLAGDALRASLADSDGEAPLEERLTACAGKESDWIRLERDSWDDESIRIFDRAAARAGVPVFEIGTPGCLRPDEIRDAAWIPSPDLSASVALYEALHAVVERNPRALRRSLSRFVGSPDFGPFLRSGSLPRSLWESEPEEAGRALAALPRPERRAVGLFLCHPGEPSPEDVRQIAGGDFLVPAATRLAAEGWFFEDPVSGQWRAADRSARADLSSAFSSEELRAFAEAWLEFIVDPIPLVEVALACGRPEVASPQADRIFGASPPSERPRALDALARAWVGRAGNRAPGPVLLHEAARLSEIGREADARGLVEAAAADAQASEPWRREARFRLALSCETAGEREKADEILRGLAEEPDVPALDRARALRFRARLSLARGDWERAGEALRSAAEAASGDRREGVEVRLVSADLASRRGRFEEEAAIYAEVRSSMGRFPDEELEGRLLLREGMLFSDRREHRAAAARFAEALQLAGDHAERRGIALTDLAISTEFLGESAAAEAYFREALACFEECGSVTRRRNAAGNLAHLLILHDRDELARPIVESLLDDSARAEDSVGKMVALAYRSRLGLRQGRFSAAARDRAEALILCDRLGDRVERAELEILESDGRLFFGDRPGAMAAARLAASRPADRSENQEAAKLRVSDLERWEAAAGPNAAFGPGEIERAFETDPSEACERVARARAFFGEPFERSWPEACVIARETLARRGRSEFVDAVFSRSLERRHTDALRRLREGLLDHSLPLRLLDEEGLPIWKSPSFQRAVWSRRLDWGGREATLEGEGEDADATAFLFETLWRRGDLETPPSAETGKTFFPQLGVVTADRSMEALGIRLSRIAPQSVTVFVSGESGTGKERIARAVHQLSPRSAFPFVAVNVAAFPEHLLEDELFGHARGAFTGADRDRAGLFEAANRGTLFLDEIGDLSPALQAKLLRVLQEREIKRIGENRYRSVDVRLVSATAKDLEKEVERGVFREDLYYRLKVASLAVPPLRERGGDAILLARHFLDRYGSEYGKGSLKWSPRASAAIRAFHWPGNVRQLENAVMEAVALADPGSTIDRDGLPAFLQIEAPEPAASGDYRARVDAYRRRLIEGGLARSRGNRTHAARELGLTRQALLYLIRELKIKG